MQKISRPVTDRRGNAIAGASVRILNANGTQATILVSDNGLAASNPLTTGPNGEYSFYAANGKYIAEISIGGVLYATDDSLLLYDPNDSEAATASGEGAMQELSTANGFTYIWGMWFDDRLAQLSDLALPGGSMLLGHRAGSIGQALDTLLRPASTKVPDAIGDLVFELTSNTQLSIKVKGSDGTVRTAILTLA